MTLPIGVRAGLTVRNGQVRLKLLEAAVAEKLGAQKSMNKNKHIRLIGVICGTAMAVAGRNAEAAWISRYRIGRCSVSTDVRFSGRTRNSGGSAV